jgi:hypothetical protein
MLLLQKKIKIKIEENKMILKLKKLEIRIRKKKI